MKRTIIYKDRAGNTLGEDPDGRLSLRNRQGRIVNTADTKETLKLREVKIAMKKHYGNIRLKVLPPRNLRKFDIP